LSLCISLLEIILIQYNFCECKCAFCVCPKCAYIVLCVVQVVLLDVFPSYFDSSRAALVNTDGDSWCFRSIPR
jgi:hypothetical protein